MQESRSIGRYGHLLVALACIASALIVLRATSRGVGLSPDSLQYLAASESAAAGDGLTTVGWDGTPTALTHYPPGYPLLLAAGARLGWSSQRAARYANIALFALTIALVAVVTRRIAPEPSWAAPIAAMFCAVAFDLVVIHSMAWSEPLYLTLTLGGLLALSAAVQRHSIKLLALTGAIAAAAPLMRYVGVANIALVALVVLCWWPAPGWQRFRIAGATSLLAAIPILATLAIGANGSDAAIANRQLVWHPIGLGDLRIAASVVAKWVTPLDDATYISSVWLAALVILAGVVMWRARQAPSASTLTAAGRRVRGILLLYAAAYLAVLVLAMSLVDAQTILEPRMLVPLLVVAIVLGVAWLARQMLCKGFVRLGAAAILALVLSANMIRLVPWIRDAQRHGLALRRLDPSRRALVDATRRLPASAHVYSNDPYFVRLQAHRIAAGLPRERNPNSLLPNSRHAKQVQAICDSAASRPTFLVIFDSPVSGDSTAQANAAARSGDVARLAGGSIIRVRPRCAF